MNVSIKTFNVDMEVKNSGIEFEIRSPDDNSVIYIDRLEIPGCHLERIGIRDPGHD